MWFAALIPLLSGLLGENGPLGQYFKTKAQQVQAKSDYDLKVLNDKKELAIIQAKAEVDSAANKIAMTTPFVKAVIISGLNLPILITCVYPAWGKAIFDSMSIIPQWYAMLDVAIIGTIFGLPIAANWMEKVFTNIQDFWSTRQDKKIEKIQALGEAGQIGRDQAKKEIFETMKKAVGLNGYTQAQVDLITPILDKYIAAQNATSDKL